MKKNITAGLLICLMTFLVAGCGANEEKIASAQEKYRNLVEFHNQIVEEHAAINDNSLDKELGNIENQMRELTDYNLYEMSDEELDMLMEVMDIIDESYTNYRKTISEIKYSEDAAYLRPIVFSLINNTDLVFTSLSIMPEGDNNTASDSLDMQEGFKRGQEILGLTIYADVNNSPWVMTLKRYNAGEGEDEVIYQVTLDPKVMTESNSCYAITHDMETDTILIN